MTAPGAILTRRDTELLLDIYKYRYLSVSQIQRLHFPSSQTAYRRLRALISLGYIKAFISPGISEHIYYLDQPGSNLVADNLGVAPAELKWQRTGRTPKDFYFLHHFLMANEFRIGLTMACKKSDITLLGFIPEYFGERTVEGGFKKFIKDIVCDISNQANKISHTPDGVFALGKDQSSALFFLEIDCGTEVISDEEKGLLKAIKFYLNYLVSGGFQRYQDDFHCGLFRGFRALIVTTSATRIENIRRVVSAFPFDEKAKMFIWLTEQSQINTVNIFQPIWRTANINDNNLYRIG